MLWVRGLWPRGYVCQLSIITSHKPHPPMCIRKKKQYLLKANKSNINTRSAMLLYVYCKVLLGYYMLHRGLLKLYRCTGVHFSVVVHSANAATNSTTSWIYMKKSYGSSFVCYLQVNITQQIKSRPQMEHTNHGTNGCSAVPDQALFS